MYLMYVDESGDCGLRGSPTDHFVLTGLVVHELSWRAALNALIDFRRDIKRDYGLGVRDELHAAALMSRPGELVRIAKHDRLAIIRRFADFIGSLPDITLINVVIDKAAKAPEYNVFEVAWRALLQRFENTISHRNFRGPANPDERGLLLPDHTDDKKLRSLLRQMRHWNPIPNRSPFSDGYRNLPVHYLIEDPNFRDSRDSYFVQAADTAAYLVYQGLSPNVYMRKKGGGAYYRRLERAFCKVASPRDPMGFVRL